MELRKQVTKQEVLEELLKDSDLGPTKDNLIKELEIYEKNMNIITDILSIVELNNMHDKFEIKETIFYDKTRNKILEELEDPDIIVPLKDDCEYYKFIFDNYHDKKIMKLKEKYKDIENMDNIINKSYYKFSKYYYNEVGINNKINSNKIGLNLQSVDSIYEFLTSNIKLENKFTIMDIIFEKILKLEDSSSIVMCKYFNSLLDLTKENKKVMEVLDEYKKLISKDELLNEICKENILRDDLLIDIYYTLNKYLKFDNKIDNYTNLEISPEAYLFNKIDDASIFKSEVYKNRSKKIQDNDILALMYKKLKTKNFDEDKIISLPNFRINELNVDFILGMLESYFNNEMEYVETNGLIITRSKLLNARMKYNNNYINNTIRLLYSKAKTSDEYEFLDKKVEIFNSRVNEKLEKFYTYNIRKESLEKIFASLLGKVNEKVNKEYDKQYSNLKINKVLKKVLTVDDVLSDKEDE